MRVSHVPEVTHELAPFFHRRLVAECITAQPIPAVPFVHASERMVCEHEIVVCIGERAWVSVN